MTLAIVCRDLKKRYDNKVDAVNGLDLEIARGECFGLLGPNGAGKTTTIEILEGLIEPTAGLVEVLGEEWHRNGKTLRERIGITLQETKLAEKLTVLETLTLFRSFYQHGRDPRRVLEQVALTEKAETWIGKLSGGQKQRLAVACALIGDPEILFLDEPTTGLDPQSRRQIWELVRDFKARGRTVLITTHYMDEAERLCDRVAVIDSGKVIALGSPQQLITSLGGEHVVEFALTDDTAARINDNKLLEVTAVTLVREEDGGYSLTISEPHLAIPSLMALLEREGAELARLSTRHASLEDVFVKLTGRHLRDE